ncbi:proton-conducting transporter transmembrane domain-containing protein [Martelella alba]|uniref:Hydrogenase 4 subunit B n=1 Tax=Martelella alba TaxID=2590451 RepID=A0ABY2SFY6_9HYPH|nr:proton-conducting transporter membrane subunit [Martelella alba]TKI03963.1 hydrogenase 4 subunit B [Martelella alba]
MAPDTLVAITLVLWLLAIILACAGVARHVARYALSAGSALLSAAAVWALPSGVTFSATWVSPALIGSRMIFEPDALWLLLFGAIAAFFATALGTPARHWRCWTVGAALSMLGALGCFGLQSAVGFLIAWEVMSLGGALLLIGERLGPTQQGHGVLFMLSLLEVGAVALLAAMLILSGEARGDGFAAFAHLGALGPAKTRWVGLLLLIGIGAKLGLLPFYEWYPGAYGQGSGASGALLSGIVLNAAFFALERAYTAWLPPQGILAMVTVALGVLSAILPALYAFQEADWRRLLAFSSAENAAIAVTLLGASQLFRSEGFDALAVLGFTVALLHLAGHSLAKSAMMLGADGAYRSTGSYAIIQRGLLRHNRRLYGIGIVFAGMSLAAMPPQAGFVSEWFTFQTLFQGFHLSGLAGRLTLAFAGAGMALTAAIALAAFIKVIGLGLLGRRDAADPPQRAGISTGTAVFCGLLGLAVLGLAVGMPWWLSALRVVVAQRFPGQSSEALHHGLLLVPLTDTFAFISPTKLVMAWPLLALIPLALLARSRLRHALRRVPVWYGGEPPMAHAAATALTFSNAMRTFYRFIYRTKSEIVHEHNGSRYFIRQIRHRAQVLPLFNSAVFTALTLTVQWLARKLAPIQSGHMNVYLGMVGGLLVLILAVAVW